MTLKNPLPPSKLALCATTIVIKHTEKNLSFTRLISYNYINPP